MIIATITTYKLLLAVHILAAVLWVGGGATLHVMGRIAQKSGDRERMNQFSKDAAYIGPRLYAPLSVILLLVGFPLVDKAGYEMSDAFIGIAFAGWIVSFLIGILYYSRADKKREAIVASEGVGSDAFLASYKQVAMVNSIELTILVLVVLDMTLKPGL
jgi:uncharacterized membrane protein